MSSPTPLNSHLPCRGWAWVPSAFTLAWLSSPCPASCWARLLSARVGAPALQPRAPSPRPGRMAPVPCRRALPPLPPLRPRPWPRRVSTSPTPSRETPWPRSVLCQPWGVRVSCRHSRCVRLAPTGWVCRPPGCLLFPPGAWGPVTEEGGGGQGAWSPGPRGGLLGASCLLTSHWPRGSVRCPHHGAPFTQLLPPHTCGPAFPSLLETPLEATPALRCPSQGNTVSPSFLRTVMDFCVVGAAAPARRRCTRGPGMGVTPCGRRPQASLISRPLAGGSFSLKGPVIWPRREEGGRGYGRREWPAGSPVMRRVVCARAGALTALLLAGRWLCAVAGARSGCSGATAPAGTGRASLAGTAVPPMPFTPAQPGHTWRRPLPL